MLLFAAQTTFFLKYIRIINLVNHPLLERFLCLSLSPTLFAIPFSYLFNSSHTVDRQQFALTPAYAFTDFKSQGQTMENVIVDITRPPFGYFFPLQCICCPI